MNVTACWDTLVSSLQRHMNMEGNRSPRKAVDSSNPGNDLSTRILDFLETVSPSRSGSVFRGKKMFGSMVDVGCGDGKSTLLFAPYFKRINGIDRSKAQVLCLSNLCRLKLAICISLYIKIYIIMLDLQYNLNSHTAETENMDFTEFYHGVGFA